MTTIPSETVQRVCQAVNEQRLMQTATDLVGIPSPTRSAAAVADRLDQILNQEGFPVERPDAGWPSAPAVVARYAAPQAGRVLQFNGHLDTVHLPMVPPRIDVAGNFYGSGASDMKGGIAAMVEAMRALRDAAVLERGAILLTAHDLHEAPWGDGSQRNALIAAGYVGDGVLLPEYVSDRLPVAGRGLAVWEIEVSRSGAPVHEVLGGIEQPSVIAAGAEIVRRLEALDQQLAAHSHPIAGRESVFIGQIAAGEIYNQSPTSLRLNGTRRWLPGHDIEQVQQQMRQLLDDVMVERGVHIEMQMQVPGDAFELDLSHPLVVALQQAHTEITGAPLPHGAKPFVDDGNSFIRHGRVPAITHGPNAKGAHTVNEVVPIAELVRVAKVYALTALAFCQGTEAAT